MTTIDTGLARLRTAAQRVFAAAQRAYEAWDRFGGFIKSLMPTGLYARSLLIIIVPMVLLQSVVAFVFMERHWNTVTRRLSAAVTQDIAALIEIYKVYPRDSDNARIRRIAAERMGLQVDFLPAADMPPVGPKPFFSLLDQALSEEIRKQIGRPYWLDTVGNSSIIEIRVRLDDAVMRIFARRSAAYASNSEIFLLWMVGTSLVLLAVAIAFGPVFAGILAAGRRCDRDQRHPGAAGLAARHAVGAVTRPRFHRGGTTVRRASPAGRSWIGGLVHTRTRPAQGFLGHGLMVARCPRNSKIAGG